MCCSGLLDFLGFSHNARDRPIQPSPKLECPELTALCSEIWEQAWSTWECWIRLLKLLGFEKEVE